MLRLAKLSKTLSFHSLSLANQNGYRNRTGSLGGNQTLIEQKQNAENKIPNGKIPSFSSTAKQTQSKVRFIKSLKGEKIKGEPIVFSSKDKKSPLSIFSSIPFTKQQQFVFNFRDSLKEHGKRRHASSRHVSLMILQFLF